MHIFGAFAIQFSWNFTWSDIQPDSRKSDYKLYTK